MTTIEFIVWNVVLFLCWFASCWMYIALLLNKREKRERKAGLVK